jgi:formate dehydrogenase iron-sulfur subunit
MIRTPGILTDVTACIGCEECVVACKKLNGLPPESPPPRRGGTADGLSADRWTTVIRRPGNRFVRKHCRHCVHPACVSACPVGALQRTPEGPVIYDKSLCMGCRYCMLACPYGIPHYEWSSLSPSVRKCTLCYAQLQSGKVAAPACVTACPTKACVFGARSDLLAEAKRRLAAAPKKYLQRVWGEKQVGGTSVLYISDISLEFLGWQDSRYLDDEPLPEKTWASLKWVPLEFVGMGALMVGLYWIIDRRRKLAGDQQAKPSGMADTPETKHEQ